MPRGTTLEPHLSVEGLERRYRDADDTVEQSHFQIVWLIAKGRTTLEVLESTAFSTRWIRKIVSRYNQLGPEGLGDHRHHNAGASPLLSPDQEAELLDALQKPPPDGGVWSGPKVAAWIAQKKGVEKIHPQRGWDYLKRCRLSLQQPRPKPAQSATPA